MSNFQNNIFIEFEYNEREINGIEDFKNVLEKSYLVQGRGKHIPSFSEGGETWFTIFINSSFFEFAKDVIIYGLAWDMLKKGSNNYFLKPFFSALKKLKKANQKSFRLKIQSLKFQFDDIDIILGGVEPHRIEIVSNVFSEVSKRKFSIEQKVKLTIKRIETPIFYNPKIDKRGYSPYLLNTSTGQPLESYVNTWKIWFKLDRECQIYKLSDESFTNAYPN